MKIHGIEAIHCDGDLETLEVTRLDNPDRYTRAAIVETISPDDPDGGGRVIIGDADLTGLLVHIINPVIDLTSIDFRIFNAGGLIHLVAPSTLAEMTGDDARAVAAALLQAADVADGISDDPIDTAWNPQVTG